MAFRIPGWADDVQIEVEDDERAAEYENGYAVLKRVWSPGDVVKLDFEMVPKWIEANPRILDDLGRVALTYGPTIYCLEGKDVDFLPQRFSANVEAEPIAEESNLLDGHVRIAVPGVAELDDFPDELYSEIDTTPLAETEATFIPYHLWNNRGPGAMQVWVRRQ
jgi:DUF1680 family protein